MIITLNYLISACAYASCYILSNKGALYRNAAKFMFFFGTAALLGGFVHHMVLDQNIILQWISNINTHLPLFLKPLDFNMIETRLWFITLLCIGFTEFYFMFLFMDPIMNGNWRLITLWLKIALVIYCIAILLSPQYFYVVLFHVFSHTTIIIFSLTLYFLKKIKALLLLVLLAIYNLAVGIMQQLMAQGIISSGPLHYNDWYHIGIIVFVIAMHLIFTKGKLLEHLKEQQ